MYYDILIRRINMKRHTGILYGLLLSAITLIVPFTNKPVYEPRAIGSQTIITTNLTDSQVNSYYTGVSGLSGTALKTELNSIISGHTSYSYTETPVIFMMSGVSV